MMCVHLKVQTSGLLLIEDRGGPVIERLFLSVDESRFLQSQLPEMIHQQLKIEAAKAETVRIQRKPRT